jgi:ribonuclease BN (tRNA processing enzyme)
MALAALLFLSLSSTALTQSQEKQSSLVTQVVLLGTGTPGWNPDSSGPSTAIVVNGVPYLVDFGPGVVRRAGAAYRKGVKALLPINLHVVFLTHRHMDHTVGYSDLIFSPAQIGGARKLPLEVYGPKGLKDMTEHILKGHILNPDDPRYKVNAHEITPGIVYKDDNVNRESLSRRPRGRGGVRVPVRNTGPHDRDFRGHDADPKRDRQLPGL